ncbi:MAG: alpha/beta hydrolase [Candidatus Omnitrophota bacterium]
MLGIKFSYLFFILIICLTVCWFTVGYATDIAKKEGDVIVIKNKFNHKDGRFIHYGDANIYVEEIGDDHLPVLILLHGGFGSIEDFNKITPALTKSFRLVGVDSRGHGRSQLGTAGLSYKVLTDDLAQIINSLELNEFNIFGFSDGGVVAYRYAIRQDARLRKIVTVGASWEMSESEPAWSMISGMTGEAWKEMFPHSYESYMQLNPAPDFDRFAIAVVKMWTDLSLDGHPGDLMNQVNNEALIIRGDKDPLTSISSMGKLSGMMKNMEFLNIPFAEHVAFDDSPDVFLDSVGKFFGIELKN